MNDSRTRTGNPLARIVHGGLALLVGLGAAACGGDLAAGDPGVESQSSSLNVGAPLPPRPLVAVTLQNGWQNAPFGTRKAGVFFDPNSGIVHFSGAVAGGTSNVLFTIPPEDRPGNDVYIPVDLCNAANGRLLIQSSGVVSVQAENGNFAAAQCFTSLEGASFAPTSAGFSALTLENGWTPELGNGLAFFGTLGGAMRFKGAIGGGSNPVLFTLPSGFRPTTNVYAPVDLCNSTNGRLLIQPSGVVSVQVEGGNFNNATCFTSLDGAWFVQSSSGVTPLTLLNGWINAPFATSPAGVENVNGIVNFKGAIANGTSAVAFTLPSGLAPSSNVYIPVDLCNATKGRLFIQPNGVVSVQAEKAFSNAQCFTSLEGASYSIAGFNP
jgi:hypothetical protein